MHMSIVSLIAVGCFAIAALGAPIREEPEVQKGMKEAFGRGSFFGAQIRRRSRNYSETYSSSDEESEEPKAKRVHSLYTKDIESPGGGKPAIIEQYLHHDYKPLSPVVVPEEIPSTGEETAEEAALRYIPKGPLAIGTERLRVP